LLQSKRTFEEWPRAHGYALTVANSLERTYAPKAASKEEGDSLIKQAEKIRALHKSLAPNDDAKPGELQKQLGSKKSAGQA